MEFWNGVAAFHPLLQQKMAGDNSITWNLQKKQAKLEM